MVAPFHRTTVAGPHVVKDDAHALEREARELRTKLGLPDNATGDADIEFEAGKPVSAVMRNRLRVPGGMTFPGLKGAAGMREDFYGSVRVRYENGEPKIVWAERSVKFP